MKVSLKSALMSLVLLVALVGLVPAALLLDQRLRDALEQGVRDDLASAPLVLAERFANQAGARMMHAKEMSSHAAVVAAMAGGDGVAAMALAAEVASAFPGEEPLLVDADGRGLLGPPVPAELLDATREGGMPVVVVDTPDGPATIA